MRNTIEKNNRRQNSFVYRYLLNNNKSVKRYSIQLKAFTII